MAFSGLEWLKKRSLTAKLAISILGSVFCCVVVLLFFFENHSTPILASHITEIAEKSLQRSVTPIVENAIKVEQAVETLKNNLSKFSYNEEKVLKDLMISTVETMNHEDSDFGSVWVYVFEPETYKEGKLYTAENVDGQVQFNVSKIANLYDSYPWFKEVPKEEEIFWTEPYVDVENKNKPTVTTCIIPFKFKGADDFNGLVSVSVYLDKIQKGISEIQFHERGKFVLFSRKGLYVVHPYASVNLTKTIYEMAVEYNVPQMAEIGQNMLELKQSGYMKLPKINGKEEHEPVMFFYTHIPYIDWGMGLFFPEEQFFEPIKKFQVQVLVFLFVILAVMFALISWICHYSTKPLLDLSKIAVQYGRGNFSADLPRSTSSDEIGVVTRAFRKMRVNLLNLIEQEKRVVADQQKASSELEIAQKIQRSALPADFPVDPNFELYASMDAAQKVGGDFYDFFYTDSEHLVIVIADVAGKGIPAALYMMTAKSLIKTAAQTNCPTVEIFTRVNKELCEGYKNDSMFITAFLAKINLKNGSVEYVCAGHNPPFVFSDGKYKQMKVARNFVLGVLSSIDFEVESIKLKKNDRLFLYTDGVTEAQNNKGDFFGERRLLGVLQNVSGSAEETLHNIDNAIHKFAGNAPRSDDITMLEFIFNAEPKEVFAIKADNSETDRVLDFVQADMKKYDIEQITRSNMLVAVGEAFSNVANYAYEGEGIVTIESTIDDVYYKLIFKDSGKKFNPLTYGDPDITKSAEERNVGGLGIYMIKKMTDLCEYQYIDGYNILTIGVRLTKNT
mgnify:CR=1 FL=1